MKHVCFAQLSFSALFSVSILPAAYSQSPEASAPERLEVPGVSPSRFAGFIENRGQWSPEVRFHARHGVLDTVLTADGIALAPVSVADDGSACLPVVLRPSTAPECLEGRDELPTRHHFFRGASSTANAAGFERVLLHGVGAGLDLQLRATEASFEYDLLAEPGAAIESFAFEVEGVERLELRSDGGLAFHTDFGVLVHRIGLSWQIDEATGVRESLRPSFRILSPTSFGFCVPGRDPARAMVIDPTIEYITYVGGSSTEDIEGMAVGADGAVYLLAKIGCCALTSPSSYDPIGDPDSFDVWAGKLSPDGSTLEWSTYLAGSKTDQGFGIALAPDGSVVIGGRTWSSDFPSTPDAFQPEHAGSSDLFPLATQQHR